MDVIVESEGNDIEVKFSFHNGFDLKLSERITTEDEYERKVGIWEHTCFELFLKNKHGEDYYEINLAANTMHWNAFYFSHYRSSPLTESTDIILKKVSASKNHFAFSLKALSSFQITTFTQKQLFTMITANRFTSVTLDIPIQAQIFTFFIT